MHGQLVVPDSAQLPILAPDSFELLDKKLAVSKLRSPQMTELIRTLSMSMDEIEVRMRRSGNPNKGELLNANADRQLKSVAAEFRKGTLIPRELLVFISQVLARIKSHYDSKDFGDEDFRLQYHASAEVKNGEDLRALPPCMSPFAETSFFITGPSGMGRTTYLQRLAEILGGPFVVHGDHPAPMTTFVTPQLLIRYPIDGKLSTLFKDLRQTILASMRDHNVKINALSQLLGGRGRNSGNSENVAIALCILLNVGLFILDGGTWQHVNKQTSHIFNFLLKLREFSGIPILVSGTSAFIHSANYMPSLNGALFNGQNMHIDMMAPPQPVDVNEPNNQQNKGLWRTYVDWLWKQGFIPEQYVMPKEFPEWLHELTLGNLRWLKQGFEAFHVAMITRPDLQKQDALTQKVVSEIFTTSLMTQQSTIGALKKIHMGVQVTESKKLLALNNLDYLPTPVFNLQAVSDIMTPIFYGRT